MNLLKTVGVSKTFGALLVLNNIGIEVREGSLHSVVGPNGAGKTTLFNVICGYLKPARGGWNSRAWTSPICHPIKWLI